MSKLISTFPKPVGLRYLTLIPEAKELDYVFFDVPCSRKQVFDALDESLLHFGAYPAPRDIAGSDDAYYVIVNPKPLDGIIKKFHGMAKGMKWLSPDRDKALFESRDSAQRYFEYMSRMEKLFASRKQTKS